MRHGILATFGWKWNRNDKNRFWCCLVRREKWDDFLWDPSILSLNAGPTENWSLQFGEQTVIKSMLLAQLPNCLNCLMGLTYPPATFTTKFISHCFSFVACLHSALHTALPVCLTFFNYIFYSSFFSIF